MKTVSNFFTRFVVFCSAIAFFTACVEDDDFDTPVIPPAQELEEILSEGGTNANFVSCLNEDFESYDDDVTSFPTYENVTTNDTRLWTVDSFNKNKYLKLSAYKAKGYVSTYFVIPVNFDKADEFSFTTQDRFFVKENPLKVFVVENYKIEDNISKAKMTEITENFKIATGTTGSSTKEKVYSGIYNLSNFKGNGFIAFKYEGDGSSVTTTIHLDDIIITDKDDANCKSDGGSNPTDDCGGSSAEAKGCFKEDFESYEDKATSFDKFFNASQKGAEKSWQVRTFEENKYIQMSAFKSGEEDDWFIIPVDFDKADEFSFETKAGFDNGKVLKVYTSTEHDGSCVVTANQWKEITSNFDIATGPSNGYGTDYTPSKNYSLSSLTGKGYIAFRYIGNGNGGTTTTMQIENINVIDKDDSNCSGTTNPTDPTQIHKGGDDAQPRSCYNLDFKDVVKGTDLFKNFEIVSVKGDNKLWKSNIYNNNSFLEISGYKVGEQDDWVLINIDFDKADTFSFKSQDGYNNGQPLTVWYSTSHTKGNDITESDWTEITSNFDIANSAPSNGYSDSFTDSKEFSLNEISGNGFIAFRFVGGDNKVTTTMRIDDIKITDKEDSTCNSTTPPPTSSQIHKGGRTAEPKGCYNEDFAGMTKDNDIFDEFETVSILGDDAFWKVGQFTQENNFFAQFSAYQKGKQDDWFLINVDFDKADTFEFKTKDGFNNGSVLNVYYSTTHSKGADIQENQWTNITSEFDIAKDAPGNTYAGAFIDSKQYSLANISGQGFIAFRYEGGGDSNTTTLMQIDDIKIIDNEDSNCGSTTPPPTGGKVTDKLFFSEYAEGASSDKYIEIYNPTNDEIDLTRYEIRLSGNKDSDWTPTRKYTFEAGKTLAGKAIYSIANPQANDDIKAKATELKGGITFFNGDDALGLFFDADGDGTFETLLDIIGVKTNDPGKGWDAAGISEATFDHTLVRKASIEKGNSDWTSSAGTNADDSEWIVKNKGDFSSLGIR